MQIRLLGTGGAEGIPGFYSDNEVSRWARAHGGKDLRTRSAAIVDEVVKIDLPPDTLCQLYRDGLDARDWSSLIFTHSHDDHYAISELQYTVYPFTELEHVPFTVYGNETVIGGIRERYPDWPMELVQTCAFCSTQIGDHKVTPIRAHHKEDEECHNLIFERGGRTLLYGTDTGIWDEETFSFVKRFRVDLLIIECTEAFRRTDYPGHLNFEDLRYVLDRLRTTSVIGPSTRIITTHHASTGGARHCDLVEQLAPLGAEPGFDGLVAEF